MRTMFNVIGRNHDDHVKNIAFLMNRSGVWRLSPAFDLTYAYDPQGEWTSRHQMGVNSKREAINRTDLIELAKVAGIKKGHANDMLECVVETVKKWTGFAENAGVSDLQTAHIQKNQNTNI